MVPVQLSPRTKARAWLMALAALTVWPVLHFSLVERFELNPWKFFGFAMYCRPTLPVRTTIEVIEDGRSVAVRIDQMPGPVRGALRDFSRNRSVLGTFREPEPVADWIFRIRPQADEVRIEVRHARIDPETGLIVEDRYPYAYRRDSGQTS